MRTAWFIGTRFLGEFDSPGTYKKSHTRFACFYCGEFFAQIVSVEPEESWWYVEQGNCGCKKFSFDESPPHVIRDLWRWSWEDHPPPMELLAEELLYRMNQIKEFAWQT